ncbi:MAG: bifunctional phosphopantothenoylcysteine decarboxylase/phosphopantothenate--cysteine ligase CoaBC [Candidatus Kapaibacterium sp.]
MSFLKGKMVLITAGPTYERIDDVRFIGNFSSGKMGFALAESALKMGAVVTLVTGPTCQHCNPAIDRVDIESADDMYRIVTGLSEKQDVIVMSAAVADYTPKVKHNGKIKKNDNTMTIELVKTKDILKELGSKKQEKQILVGFALESEKLVEYAKGKLERKNCNIIVANQANSTDGGFGKDINTVTIIDDKNNIKEVPTAPKSEIADIILQYVSEYSELL